MTESWVSNANHQWEWELYNSKRKMYGYMSKPLKNKLFLRLCAKSELEIVWMNFSYMCCSLEWWWFFSPSYFSLPDVFWSEYCPSPAAVVSPEADLSLLLKMWHLLSSSPSRHDGPISPTADAPSHQQQHWALLTAALSANKHDTLILSI